MSLLAIAFLAVTVLSIVLFARAHRRSERVFWCLLVYAIVQFEVATTGFYQNTTAFPPRFLLNVLPSVAAVLWLFLTKSGKAFKAGFVAERLLWVHVVRVPVEVVLYGMFLAGTVPKVMTFAGWNFDIVAGLTAPLIWWLLYRRRVLSPGLVKIWHGLALLLLANIVVTAVLSLPFSFQQFGFEQPNVGLLAAPFNLLPAVVVPLVLVAHLVAIVSADNRPGHSPDALKKLLQSSPVLTTRGRTL